MRRRNSACWIFSALLVLGVATGSASDSYLHQNGRSAQHLATGEYVLGAPLRADSPSIPVTLPHRFGSAPPSQGRRTHWVRFSFRLDASGLGVDAVYIPYAQPRAAVYLNGVYVGASQEFDVEQSDTWNYPLYLPLSTALLHPGVNQLLVETVPHVWAHATSELGPVWVGERASLRPLYDRRLWAQVTGVEVVSLFVGVIGAFVALLWLRRREALFGLFALSCAVWIVRNAQFFVVHAYDLFDFSVITDSALFWLVAVLYNFSFRALDRRFPRIEAAFYAYALLATVAMYAAGIHHKWTVTAVAFAGQVPLSVIYLAYLTRETFRARSVLLVLLWLSAVASSATGAYDLALMVEWIPGPATYLMPYSALAYALTVGWALIDRFVKTHNEYERLNAALESRIKERETALAVHYARATSLERERAVAAERDRILRDMHDGLGLQLISARQLIETGRLSREEIASILGQAMDELRIAIDSMKPDSHDLLLMLGNLRYRLEPRLNGAGITLHWDVAGATELNPMSAAEVMEVTRIVQEVCTNAIKHSRATEMRLTVRCPSPDTLLIAIVDNGCGFEASTAHRGEGVKNMRRRARRIGARLDIESRAGETRTTLKLSARGARSGSLDVG